MKPIKNKLAHLCLSIGLLTTSCTALGDSLESSSTDKPVKLTLEQREKIKDAVVHVYVVKHTYSTLSPWNSDSVKGSGSGLIIKGGLILTNAHVAADATFLEVQRHGETRRHEAEVAYISHESDLALLRTKQDGLYNSIDPLELGSLPKMQQQVEVYGFPIGGNTLSVTRGVVSRIEKQNYAHTGENLIAVQVDAAINFGNSGGPVISSGKVVGVAMQSGFFTENIGYMIPTPIIRHFLKDIEDKKQDGFGFPGFLIQSMENPSMRRKYGLEESQTGILVYKIYPDSPAGRNETVKVGDIITHIDGHKIQNNGTVEFRPGEYIDYTHYIDLHQLGEKMGIQLIREGKPLEVTLELDKPGKEYLLVKPNEYDKQPSYFIYGGFVFMPLNQDLIDVLDPVPAALAALSQQPPTEKLSEVVLMTKVLPADINKDYHHTNNVMISKINGRKFSNFIDFFNMMQNSKDKFLQLEANDGFQIIIEREEARQKQPSILQRYGVNSDRSKDLQALSSGKMAKESKPSSADKTTAATKKEAAQKI